MPKVVVYLPARSAKELAAAGHDPAEWVRNVVRGALREQALDGHTDGSVARPRSTEAGGAA